MIVCWKKYWFACVWFGNFALKVLAILTQQNSGRVQYYIKNGIQLKYKKYIAFEKRMH